MLPNTMSAPELGSNMPHFNNYWTSGDDTQTTATPAVGAQSDGILLPLALVIRPLLLVCLCEAAAAAAAPPLLRVCA